MPVVDGNLLLMHIDNNHWVVVARAWGEARAQGEDQASFCARQVPPISQRTLRQWVKTFGTATGDNAGSDIKLIYAALANMKLLADLFERDRLRGMPTGRSVSAPAPAPMQVLPAEELARAVVEFERHRGTPAGVDLEMCLEKPENPAPAEKNAPAAAERHGGIEPSTQTENVRKSGSSFWDEP